MWLFFPKWEQERPSLCIKMMHTALFIKAVSKVFKVLLQPSRVDQKLLQISANEKRKKL
jgi:hypothetical protein